MTWCADELQTPLTITAWTSKAETPYGDGWHSFEFQKKVRTANTIGATTRTNPPAL